MDEITLFNAVRPAAPDFDDEDRQAARQRLLEAAADESSAPSGRAGPGRAGNVTRLSGRRRVAIGAVAAAAAVAAVLGVAVTGSTGTTGASPGPPGGSHTGPAVSAAELVAYATQAAAAGPPFAPQPHQWIYTRTLSANSSAGGGGYLFGPPNERQTSIGWMRADHLQSAGFEHGRLVVSPVLGVNKRYTPAQTRLFQQVAERGSVLGWPDSSYPRLESLPANPAQLTALIKANLRAEPNPIGAEGQGNPGVFNAIQSLMENTVLPPRLLAALYGVLARDPAVHFDPSVPDLAGRTGVGFSLVEDGYVKEEIVINPRTYAYLGEEAIAIKAHDDVDTAGRAVHIRQGQVLGWDALLASGIVNRPGQVP